MVFGRLLLPAVALGLLVAGHPAVNSVARRDVELAYVTEAGETMGSSTEDARLSSVDRAWRDTLPKGARLSSPGASPPSASHSHRPAPAQGQGDIHKSLAPIVQVSAGKSKPVQPDNDNPSGVELFNISSDATKSFGVSYAPYRTDHQCKSKDEIAQDFKRIVQSSLRRFGKAYSMVRIYGTDCDQVAQVHAAAKAHGVKVFLGIWEPAAVKDEAQEIVNVFRGDWGMVDTVSVGNELVNNGKMYPAKIGGAVGEARSILREAGYQGPVVTVDTFNAYIANPILVQASDYCAVNAHAFFDSTVLAENAGEWLQNTVQNVKTVCKGSNKRVVVTETGWPSDGLRNGKAVPTLQNQRLAIGSITRKFSANPSDVILFSAFNDLWKERNAATFNAEQSWGITE